MVGVQELFRYGSPGHVWDEIGPARGSAAKTVTAKIEHPPPPAGKKTESEGGGCGDYADKRDNKRPAV